MITQTISQANFYREFLMARNTLDPHDYGVDLTTDQFRDQMVEEFHGAFRDSLSLDELLLRPRTALRFCENIREKHSYHDLPDDIILRSVMHRRKNL